MKALLLLTGSGAIAILASYTSISEPALLQKLAAKCIRKFISFEISFTLAQERYAGHFFVVAHDLHETDDLRVLDFDGAHAFQLFRFQELGAPISHEGS